MGSEGASQDGQGLGLEVPGSDPDLDLPEVPGCSDAAGKLLK